jgi:hypothetical protein
LIALYPHRLFSVERKSIRSRIVIVIRRVSGKKFDWAKALQEAA